MTANEEIYWEMKDMSLKEIASAVFRELRDAYKTIQVHFGKDYKLDFAAAELIRNTHSIEKGLCISEPRLGFGHEKQNEMMKQIELLSKTESAYYHEICDMAVSALLEYLDFHTQNHYTDEFCEKLRVFIEKYGSPKMGKIGGTLFVEKKSIQFDEAEIVRFMTSRHSIRDFDTTPIDESKLEKALQLAQTAPSACNRQGVRVYVLSEEQGKKLVKQLSGVGGFADQVNRFIVITGKRSAYRLNESKQHIVSASIYAGYLTLTLHLYGFGACVIQRPVLWNKTWMRLSEFIGANKDEQIVCLLAVGNLKDSFRVPCSHRLHEIVKINQ